jgi:hypothetical protein
VVGSPPPIFGEKSDIMSLHVTDESLDEQVWQMQEVLQQVRP